MRKRWQAFGLGTLEFLHPENRKVLAYVRRYQDECILVVANLSRFVQPVELDLSPFQSRVPVELFGRTEFPVNHRQAVFSHARPACVLLVFPGSEGAGAGGTAGAPGGCTGAGRSCSVGERLGGNLAGVQSRAAWSSALQSWLPSRRWFAGKARTIKAVHICWKSSRSRWKQRKLCLPLLQVEYAQTEPETYVLPLACAVGKKPTPFAATGPARDRPAVLSKQPNQDGVLYDAIADKAFCRALLELISNRRSLQGKPGELTAAHTAVLRRLRMEGGLELEPSVSKAEQSNSSVIYGDRLFLKLFRRLDVGINPDLEIARFLAARKFP